MKQWGIDALYSSCMQRTLETALPIYKNTGVPWHVWPALSETDRRRWPKLRELQALGENIANSALLPAREHDHPNHIPLTKLRERFGVFATDQPFPWPDEWWLPLEGETREQTYERADQVIRYLVQRYRGSDIRIAVVCHGAFGSVLLTRFMHCPPSDNNLFGQAHTAISAIDIFDDYTQVTFSNYVGHLPPEWVTEGVDFHQSS